MKLFLLSLSIVFVGSNRQSKKIDDINSPNRGSCFPAIKQISTYLGARLDNFLLADVFSDLPDGTSYEHAINQEYKHEHGNWLFDETKVTILYAQMHKIGVDHYDKPIVFDFYDDRRNNGSDAPDILEWLGAFYLSNSQLILQNIILRLNHYEWVGYNPSF